MLTSMPALRKHSPALVWCTDHTTQQMPRLRAGLLFGSLLLDGHEEALRMLHNADKLLPVHRLERLPHHRATHPFFAECAAVIGLSEPPERRQELPGPACKVTTSPKSWPRSRQRNACCTAAGCCCRCRQSRKDEASATFLGWANAPRVVDVLIVVRDEHRGVVRAVLAQQLLGPALLRCRICNRLLHLLAGCPKLHLADLGRHSLLRGPACVHM